MDTCEQIRELLSAQLDGELAPGDAERIEAHLDSCAECREIAAAWQRVDLAIAQTGRRIAPGASVRDAVLDRVRRGRTVIPWPAWVRWAAAACLLLVGALIARIALQNHDGGPGPVAAVRGDGPRAPGDGRLSGDGHLSGDGRLKENVSLFEEGRLSARGRVDETGAASWWEDAAPAEAAPLPGEADAAFPMSAAASTSLDPGSVESGEFLSLEGMAPAGGRAAGGDSGVFHAETGFARASTSLGLPTAAAEKPQATATLARKSERAGVSGLADTELPPDREALLEGTRRYAAEMCGPETPSPERDARAAGDPAPAAAHSLAAAEERAAVLSDEVTDSPDTLGTGSGRPGVREDSLAHGEVSMANGVGADVPGEELVDYACFPAGERNEFYETMDVTPEGEGIARVEGPAGAMRVADVDRAGRLEVAKERYAYTDARAGYAMARSEATDAKGTPPAVGRMRFVALDPADAVRVGQTVARHLQGDLVPVNDPRRPGTMLVMNRLVLPESNLDAFVGELDSRDVRIVDLRDPPSSFSENLDEDVDDDGPAAGNWTWSRDERLGRRTPADAAGIVAGDLVAKSKPTAPTAGAEPVEGEPVAGAAIRRGPGEPTRSAAPIPSYWSAGRHTPTLVRFDVEIASPRLVPAVASAGGRVPAGSETR